MFQEVTINPRAILAALGSGYVFLHVMFGLVTHYHSVWQVRKHNKKVVARDKGGGTIRNDAGLKCISSFPMVILFAGRMLFGLPWFLLVRVISPTGNRWHQSPTDIQHWGT